jgi:hypothetical protein
MVERAKTEEVSERFLVWPSRVMETLASMPLSLKLGLLVLITLLPRVLASLQPQIITLDGTHYVQMAKLFSEGKYEGIARSYFTLYPLLIWAVQKFTVDWELSGQLISITFGTLGVIPIFLLGRSLYNEKVGWLSALFYITLPNFLKFDIQVLRDPGSWFFIATTLWLVWEGVKKNRLILLACASISAGLGAVTRVDGFIVWGALILYTAFQKVSKVSLKRRILSIAILTLLFPILLSPIFFSMKSFSEKTALGEMVSFSVRVITSNMRAIVHPQDPIDAMGRKTYDSLPRISQNSLELASRPSLRVVLAIPEVIYKFIKAANLLIVLIFLGIWKRKREGFQSSDWYLLYVFGALFIMSTLYARQIYYFSTRHGLTLVLPTLFFAGHGLDFITERFYRGLNRLTPGWSFVRKYLLHLLTIFFIIIFLAHGISFKRTDKFIQKETGLWLKEKGYQGSVIMGPRQLRRLAFYADGAFLEMPDSWEKVTHSIQTNEVKIVVVDSCTIEQDCPGFLGKWPQAGLFLLSAPVVKKEKCPIQIYVVR